MPRLTADLVLSAPSFINPLRERQLDLRGKMIPAIENLGTTQVHTGAIGQVVNLAQDQYDTIDFTDNEIEKLENFPILTRLQTLYFNNNHINKLSPGLGDSLPKLETLILSNNRFVNLHDIDLLAEITSLKTLALNDNVIAKKPNYRLYVIHKLPNVRLLDYKKVKAKERLESVKLFGPPANMQKKKKGKKFLQQVQQQKTFTPGQTAESSTTKVQIDTPVDQLTAKIAIESAKTMEEVQKVERLLKTGKQDVTMSDT